MGVEGVMNEYARNGFRFSSTCKDLVLGRHFFAGELFDGFLCPAEEKKGTTWLAQKTPLSLFPLFERKETGMMETHISPNATIQMVCHTPSPILGVTPRYNPPIPLFE